MKEGLNRQLWNKTKKKHPYIWNLCDNDNNQELRKDIYTIFEIAKGKQLTFWMWIPFDLHCRLEVMNEELNKHMEKVLKARADAAAADAQAPDSHTHSPTAAPSKPAAGAAAEQAGEATSAAASESSAPGMGTAATHTGKTAALTSRQADASASQHHGTERRKEEEEWEQGCVCVAKFADNGRWGGVCLLAVDRWFMKWSVYGCIFHFWLAWKIRGNLCSSDCQEL